MLLCFGDQKQSGSPIRTVARLLDVPVDRLRLPDLLATVIARAQNGTPSTVMYVNAHCMNVQYVDPEYHRILQHSDIVYCDGTGVRLAARLAGLSIPERMTGADWIDGLAALCARNALSLFLLGGAPGAARETAQRLRARHDGLRIAGYAEGYAVGTETVQAVNQSGADILLVGMGTPRQEKWIARYREDIHVPVVWAVGALFDFVSGRIPRGPKWMTDHGLEWLCRLVAEPKKLWRRYVFGNPVFFWRVVLWRLRAVRAGRVPD